MKTHADRIFDRETQAMIGGPSMKPNTPTPDPKPWWWDTERCPNCKDQHAEVCGCFDDPPTSATGPLDSINDQLEAVIARLTEIGHEQRQHLDFYLARGEREEASEYASDMAVTYATQQMVEAALKEWRP